MTLITSISGIRGTIGGIPGEALTPIDAVKFASAYAAWLKESMKINNPSVVLGRDARISGPMVDRLVTGALIGMGVDVINISLATTPTVEMAVQELKADGGIILTASHNPGQWNALKLLNNKGEFLSAADGARILELVEEGGFQYSSVDELGATVENLGMNDFHIQKVLDLSLVDVEKIKASGFKVVVDCVNSVGGVIIPELLKRLGVQDVVELYCEPNGQFPHNPEPIPENLTGISSMVVKEKADLGFVVDPDVDRLAIINEDGTMFGEEYTLVAVADYILGKTPGNTCSNLSSSRALRYITEKYGKTYFASAVGEVNVVEKMKAENCVIGGEGNGGVIYPEIHYGRDALVGIALFLTHLAEKKIRCSELRALYPDLTMIKRKIELTPDTDVDGLLMKLRENYKNEKITVDDGLKVDFEKGWIHFRKSNTEPIIRLYAEAENLNSAESLINDTLDAVNELQ